MSGIFMNYATKETFSLLPSDVRKLCSDFCETLGFVIDIFESNIAMSSADPLRRHGREIGFALASRSNAQDSNQPTFIGSTCMHRDMDSLAKDISEKIDLFLTILGETRTSLEMKARLKGVRTYA